MTFPADPVPDGNVLLAHHLTYPLLPALLMTLQVWPRQRLRNPWLVLAAILGALWGFTSGWTQDPTLGAAVTGASLLVGLAAVTVRPMWRREWPQRYRVAIGLLFAAAADDWLSHALGWPTPLDYLFHVLPLWAVAVVAIGAATVVYGALRFAFPPATGEPSMS